MSSFFNHIDGGYREHLAKWINQSMLDGQTMLFFVHAVQKCRTARACELGAVLHYISVFNPPRVALNNL